MIASRKHYKKVHWKTMNDAVHGHIRIHPLVNAIIDTPQFQRLRNIKQLGVAYYVYPSACHNRFEHSIGTYHLAGKFLEMLNDGRETSEEKKEEREKDMLCVQIAALCHDLGHGPFSHLWEAFLKRNNIDWAHEDNSIKMFDLMLEEEVVDKYGIITIGKDEQDPNNCRLKLKELFQWYNLTDFEINFIKDLITGKKIGSTATSTVYPSEKHYLFQIVNNKDNDIDVDKFDYICRDSKMVNVPVLFDPERILKYAQIMKANNVEQICFRDKIVPNIADMFMARAVLHDIVYQHCTVKIIQEMLIDALTLLAETSVPTLLFTDAGQISRFTDYIYDCIQLNGEDSLIEGRKLLQRIAKRELYSLIIRQEIKHSHNIKQKRLDAVTGELHNDLQRNGNSIYNSLQVQDLGIIIFEIDTGKSNQETINPLENVYIFQMPKFNNSYEEPPAKKCKLEESTSLTPTLTNPDFFKKNILKRKMLIIYKGENQDVLKALHENEDIILKNKEIQELINNK